MPHTEIIDGFSITVDEQHADILRAHKWRHEMIRGKGYVRRHFKKSGKTNTVYLHQEILGRKVGFVIDHIDGDTTNNQTSNLRFVTQAQNAQNLHRPKVTSKSGVLGVNWHKQAKKWRTQIRLNGATIHIGYFSSKEEASIAYLAKKRELHPACAI